MTNLTPRVNKRTLLIIASFVWFMAGFMVFKLGFEVITTGKKYILISLVVAAIVFYIFFNFIFKKMVKKHSVRISAKEQEKLCVFSFFDIKSYIIMAIMMTLGITIRSLSFINPIYWAPVYVGIGTALLSAGVLFAIEWKKFS